VSAPNWYDVLDVDAAATTEEIRVAWRDAIADLTPADRRFRLYNQAAEVLLDPERRTAHDAVLAEEAAAAEPAEPAEPETSPAVEPDADRDGSEQLPAEPSPEVAQDARPARAAAPTWLLAGLAILAALSLGLAAYLFTQPSESALEDATGAARAAAERAAAPVLSYDYRTLEEDQAAAHDLITSDYREDDYDPLFEVIIENAPPLETVVEVEVIASSITRAGEDRVEVLLFVNRPTTNAQTKEPVVYKDQVTFTMEKVDDEWLVDDLSTSPVAQ